MHSNPPNGGFFFINFLPGQMTTPYLHSLIADPQRIAKIINNDQTDAYVDIFFRLFDICHRAQGQISKTDSLFSSVLTYVIEPRRVFLDFVRQIKIALHYGDINAPEFQDRINSANLRPWQNIHLRNLLISNFEISRCEHCGSLEHNNQYTEVLGLDYTICRRCTDDSTVYLDRYERYVYSEHVVDAIDEDGELVDIFNQDRNFVWNSNSDQYEHREYNRRNNVIGSYHSTKSKHQKKFDIWSNENHRWFGVELEVEVVSGDRTQKAIALNEAINNGEIGHKVFFEQDGSLDNGIEIISHPMSLPAHRELWQWTKNEDLIRGMKSNNTSTCGLHVHLNRDGLSPVQIAKMVSFINDENNQRLIHSIARRYRSNYSRFKVKKFAAGSATNQFTQSSDRYEAINVTPSETIEFRIFKGTLKYESIIACIEFTHALAEFCLRNKQVEDLNTPRFLEYVNESANDAQYLKEYFIHKQFAA